MLSFWEYYSYDQFHFFSLLWYIVDFESTKYKRVPCLKRFLFFLILLSRNLIQPSENLQLSQKFILKLSLSCSLIPKEIVFCWRLRFYKRKCFCKEHMKILFLQYFWVESKLSPLISTQAGILKETQTLFSVITTSVSICVFSDPEPQY